MSIVAGMTFIFTFLYLDRVNIYPGSLTAEATQKGCTLSVSPV